MAAIWTDEQTATKEVQQVADAVKDEAKTRIQAIDQIFVAKIYCEQDEKIMLGKVLLIKVDIGNPDEFVHMEVFAPSKKSPVLLAIQEKYTECDPLEPLF